MGHLIFNELLPSWHRFDDKEQMSRIGRQARWADIGRRFGMAKRLHRVSHYENEVERRNENSEHLSKWQKRASLEVVRHGSMEAVRTFGKYLSMLGSAGHKRNSA